MMKITDIRPIIRFAEEVSYTLHRNFTKTYDCRLLYVIGGEGNIYVKWKEYEIKAGLLVLFQPGTLYKITPKPLFKAFVVDFDFTDEYKDETMPYAPVSKDKFDYSKMHKNIYFQDAEIFNEPIVQYESLLLESTIRELIREYRWKQLFYIEKSSNLLKNMFFDIAREHMYSDKSSQLASSVIEYIYRNYNNDVSNATLSRIFNYDACYLNRVVKKYTGNSLHSFVLNYRVDMGVKLLLTTDYTLEEIAERTGFFSASHFSLRCKEKTGRAPSYYRKK